MQIAVETISRRAGTPAGAWCANDRGAKRKFFGSG